MNSIIEKRQKDINRISELQYDIHLNCKVLRTMFKARKELENVNKEKSDIIKKINETKKEEDKMLIEKLHKEYNHIYSSKMSYSEKLSLYLEKYDKAFRYLQIDCNENKVFYRNLFCKINTFANRRR